MNKQIWKETGTVYEHIQNNKIIDVHKISKLTLLIYDIFLYFLMELLVYLQGVYKLISYILKKGGRIR